MFVFKLDLGCNPEFKFNWIINRILSSVPTPCANSIFNLSVSDMYSDLYLGQCRWLYSLAEYYTAVIQLILKYSLIRSMAV